MAIGEIAKQLATHALLSQDKPAAPTAENIGATILGQVQAMQKKLKEDEELLVEIPIGAGTIRVLEFFLPSSNVIVITGLDAQRNVARVISPADRVQLVCKVIESAAARQARAHRIRLAQDEIGLGRAMVSIQNVSKVYHLYKRPSDRIFEVLPFGSSRMHSEFWALRDINLSISRGEILALVGPNGSGKSTLLQIVAGILKPTRGRVITEGALRRCWSWARDSTRNSRAAKTFS